MKKVLILSNVTYDLYSMRREVVQALLDKGFEIIISAIQGQNTDDFENMGCRMITSPIDRRGMNPIADLKLISHYIKIINRNKPDIVLTYTIKPNVYGGIACSILDTPYLSNITGLGSAVQNGGIIRKISTMLYRIGLRKSSCVFLQNKENADFAIRNRIAIGKCRIIPGSGVNLKQHKFEEYPGPNEAIEFVFIGRIMKEKGIAELFYAAEKIISKYPQIKFNLIGGVEEEYQDKLERCKNQGGIFYYGRQDDVHSFIKNNHAIVMPSYHEGMSNVLLEAAATGRPILASNIAGCRETFDEGISGFGFQVKNADDLTDKLLKFIELPYEEKKTMGKTGRIKMEKEFNREFVVNAYINEIEKAFDVK